MMTVGVSQRGGGRGAGYAFFYWLTVCHLVETLDTGVFHFHSLR